MAKIINGTKFIVTSTNTIHCLDGKCDTNQCLSNLKKEYPIISKDEANILLLNDPKVKKCEFCLAYEDYKIID